MMQLSTFSSTATFRAGTIIFTFEPHLTNESKNNHMMPKGSVAGRCAKQDRSRDISFKLENNT
jgi:hypothetical protein